MSNILTLSISELVSKLKSGDISSVELCSAYIDRYDKFEKDVKAWAYFDKKLLLEKATEADENRKAGKPRSIAWFTNRSKRYFWYLRYAY